MLSSTQSAAGAVVVVSCQEMTRITAHRLGREFDLLLPFWKRQPPSTVVIDLHLVLDADIAGVGFLLRAWKIVAETIAVPVRVARPTDNVARVLAAARLAHVIPIRRSIREAMAG